VARDARGGTRTAGEEIVRDRVGSERKRPSTPFRGYAPEGETETPNAMQPISVTEKDRVVGET
jgi:hypothetical protein